MKRVLLTGAGGFVGHHTPSKDWDDRNREARRSIGQRFDQKRKGTAVRKRQLAEVRQRRHIRVRLAVLERYGGACAFCGCDQFEFLTVDHIHNDGKAHRAEIASRYRGIYDYLYRTEFRPDLFRILCANCHLALTKYGVEPSGETLRAMSYWREFGALRR